MFNGQAAAHVAHSPDRPNHIPHRSGRSSWYSSQRKRSSTEEIHSAAFTPVEDSKRKLKSPRLKQARSAPTSPTSLTMLECFAQQSGPTPLRQDRGIDDSGLSNLFNIVDELRDPESTLIQDVEDEAPQGPGAGRHSIHSGFSIPRRLAPGNGGDLIRPHYASSGDLKSEPESYLLNEGDRSGPVPYQGPLRPNSASPPYDHKDDYDQSREDSTSSVSSYLRANAFRGHRDTLARIDDTWRTTGPSSAPLALYPSPTSSSVPSSLLTRHRDTFARINYRRHPALPVPKAVFKILLEYVTLEEYKALRLTCRVWLQSLPPPRLPGSYRIPSELLQEVYSSLSPIDFDTARHTCRSWFVASLHRRLLEIMTRRAGCYASTQADLLIRRDYYGKRRQSMNGRMWAAHDNAEIEDFHQPEIDDVISEVWVYSKRLAIESMLSPDWRGVSIGQNPASSTDIHARLAPIGSVEFFLVSQPQCQSTEATFMISNKPFTVSGCGKYVLVTSGRVAFVCGLLRRKPGIQPLTRIVCPRNVLAVSMDTSSKRYDVAILLEGRVGMCCNLTEGFGDSISTRATQGTSIQLGMSADVRGSESTATTAKSTVTTLPLRRAEIIPSVLGGRFHGSRASEPFISPAPNTNREPASGATWFDSIFSECNPREESAESGQEATTKTGIPIENGPRTVYKNLCSFDDPPRSVAICPQRRCVAFGCRMGIELHWIDALTGSDLNRWFPLAAPSDYLYFLPVREGVDSAKKLRLISSAAGPYAKQQETTSVRGSPSPRLNWRTSPNDSRRQSITGLFFGNLPFPTTMAVHGIPGDPEQNGNISPTYTDHDHGVLRTVDCDHYCAVPLSDGAHLLFTDPETGLLCLGSDAPLGGPTKLLRKFVCLPPDAEDTRSESEENERSEKTPSRTWLMCYAAGQDLRWGLKIAAAYSDGRIMLYCISSDAFEKLRRTRAGIDVWDERVGLIGQSDLLMDAFMQGDLAHRNASTASHAANEAGALPESLTDLANLKLSAFRGIEIGRASGQRVIDLAVSCDFGGLRVWAFMQNGLVRMWTLFRMWSGREETWVVSKDGIVRKKEDATTSEESISPTTTPLKTEAPASPAVIDGLKSAQVPEKKDKGKERLKSERPEGKQHIRFVGSDLDGAADIPDHTGALRQGLRPKKPPKDHRSHQSKDCPLLSSVSCTLCYLE